MQNCFICRKGITDEDNFVKIQDYFEGKWLNAIFAHSECWEQHMSNKKMLQKAIDLAGDIKDNLLIN